MGQEQSGLAFRPSETEEYDPPILQDKDHKALEDRASKVLQETKKENSDQRPGPQPDRVFEGGTPGESSKENQQACCSMSAADEGCGAWLTGSIDLKEVLRESHFKDIEVPTPSPKIAAVPSQAPMSPRAKPDIHSAVVEGNLKEIQRLVREGISLESTDKEGRTPLAMAAFLGRAAIARELLSMGSDKDARDLAGNTPLHHAATGSSDQGIMALRNVTMEHLIAAAAHLEAPNKQGRAPLHIAAASNNFRALRKLLNAGAHRAPIDADGLRPVDLANMLGFSDMVIHLTNIDTKAQVDKIKQYQQWL